MEKLMAGALAEALRRGRERYNTKFAYARRARPSLDAEAFKEHLRVTLSPIVEAAHAAAPARLDAVVDALYDLSLDLIGREFFGRRTRYPAVLEGWHKLFAGLPHLLAAAPRRFAGAVTNALYNLSATPGARPDFWVEEMGRLGAGCRDVAEFLEVGKVVAWRAGMPHYREGALAACAGLDEGLARAALGVADGPPPGEVIDRLRRDPWYDPSRAGGGERRLRVVRWAGGFRGFGGLFPLPPTVKCANGDFVVYDTESWWLLTADAFGATFHRLGPEAAGLKDSGARHFTLNRQGLVMKEKHVATFPELADCASYAANETTLAVTVPLSHTVYLVALADGAPN